MTHKYTSALAVALILVATGITSASAQTTGSTGYDMLNAQSANPSATTNSTIYGSTSTTANSTYPSATSATDTTGTTNSTTVTATPSTTPGVPNTGSGGDAPVNLAILIISGLVVAAGMTYVTLKLAL